MAKRKRGSAEYDEMVDTVETLQALVDKLRHSLEFPGGPGTWPWMKGCFVAEGKTRAAVKRRAPKARKHR